MHYIMLAASCLCDMYFVSTTISLARLCAGVVHIVRRRRRVLLLLGEGRKKKLVSSTDDADLRGGKMRRGIAATRLILKYRIIMLDGRR